jgi:hypothetical protein
LKLGKLSSKRHNVKKGLFLEENSAQGTAVMGMFEVDLFPEEVNSADHPEAREFKKALEAVAADFRCKLLSFEVDHGTVSFVFDSDELNAEILRVLESK